MSLETSVGIAYEEYLRSRQKCYCWTYRATVAHSADRACQYHEGQMDLMRAMASCDPQNTELIRVLENNFLPTGHFE